MKRAIIIGATSGIGREVATLLLAEGWQVGVAGRREDKLQTLAQQYPGQVYTQALDVNSDEASSLLEALWKQLETVDLFLLSSGIGKQNPALNADIEVQTTLTNVVGFTQMVDTAFRLFKQQSHGHLAVISSVAGTKGIGIAPAYSATKRYQSTYLNALEQLATQQKLPLIFTDIRPGFVKTDLLDTHKTYPLLMDVSAVSRQIVSGLKRKKRVLIIDWRYRILVEVWRLLPQWLWKRLPIK